ncbi:hypothetical protein KI387_025101 [Taxus chinensis]|uniref:NPF family transporter n=1 Tax=Taxus chinensis TaxID=29808 RepID=A0AA38L928_TAXCH|nr:hypothetical protein KI387_025101 [Taxus chinensis]
MEELRSSSDFVEDGSVDLHGHAVIRAHTGTWKASLLIIGVEIAERFAYAGILSNLVTYLTTALHESTATAASNVNIWSGVGIHATLFGRHLLPIHIWPLSRVSNPRHVRVLQKLAPEHHIPRLCFFSSHFIWLLWGKEVTSPAYRPLVQTSMMRGTQKRRSIRVHSLTGGILVFAWGPLQGSLCSCISKTNVGWGVGFGIPAATMAMTILVFLFGTRFYRHKLPSGSPLTRIIHVFVAAYFKRNAPIPCREPKKIAAVREQEVLKTGSRRHLLQTNRFRFLDKATVEEELDFDYKGTRNWRLCTVQQVEEVKLLIGMSPIWMACLMFGVVFAQSSTFFTKQGSTMDRKMGPHFEIPPASLQAFIDISIILLVPVYDRIFVPTARKLTGNARGITLLQRIGTGMFVSAISMIVAAVIEMKRVKAAKDNGLVDMPHATIPLSIFWLLPQYVLFGIADVFTMVGMQEYFYDQMPDTMKSLGIAVYLSVLGVGSFLSSILISVIDKLSCRSKEQCWFANNVNKAHLDYFYWLLASLSLLNLGMFIVLASCYRYKTAASVDKEEPFSERTLLAT